MVDEERFPPGGESQGSVIPKGWRSAPAAVYGLEHPVRCPVCGAELAEVFVVRLYRLRVAFMSSLPRSGRLIVCPHCRAVLSGELGAVL